MTLMQFTTNTSVPQPPAWVPLSPYLSEALALEPSVPAVTVSDESQVLVFIHHAHQAATYQSLIAGERRRYQLLSKADQQLWTFVLDVDGTIARACIDTARALLRHFVTDGQPTPQLTRNPAGGVEINWLVDGTQATLLIEADGEWMFWAERPTGEEFFNADGDPRQAPKVATVVDVQHLLQSMGRCARYLPSI